MARARPPMKEREPLIEVKGEVTEALPNAVFRVRAGSGSTRATG